MKVLATLAFLLPFAASGQTNWLVNSGGSTQSPPDPYYSPQDLTISIGDSVTWHNVSGTHSVNGSLTEFPGNPEGFSSGDPDNGGWYWGHRFNIPGLYNYHCTQQGHAATQFGTINVLNNVGLPDMGDGNAEVKVYPVPSSDVLYVEVGSGELRSAQIVGLDGAMLLSVPLKSTGRSTIQIDTLASGNYFLLVKDAKGVTTARPFSKR